ncbi:MAG TPA: hypothetical protein VHK91_14920 [Flavisolibacter sp.]|jgi:hypothetical protein|nr:hypothetical protein [Flavisolibacter sp.]
MKRVGFPYCIIQGRIGKRFVVKHYKKYKLKGKYPNMEGIIPSKRQKRQRRLFRLAVQYAQSIYWNPKKRAEKERIYRRPWRLFQKLMKEWFKKREAKRAAARRRLNIWRRNVELNKGKLMIVGPGSTSIAQSNPTIAGQAPGRGFASTCNDGQMESPILHYDRLII